MRRTNFALLVAACFAFSLAPPQDKEARGTRDRKDPDPRFTPQAEKHAEELMKRIGTEVDRLGGAHAWAGSYYEGDGLGSNLTLHLAPESGFVLHVTGCMGLYDRDFGMVVPGKDQIVLDSTIPSEGKKPSSADRVLVPMSWGDRRYLIAPEQFPEFCDDVNEGTEPRVGSHGSYLLKNGDELKPANGLPVVPEKYRHLLLKEPVVATVTRVISRNIDEQGDPGFLVELDVGEDQGLRLGMRMAQVRPEGWRLLRLKELRTQSSTAIVVGAGARDPRPEAGWKFSTRIWTR